MITGHTRVAALIGAPARHSLSPIILNTAFAELGLDWCFVVFEVPAGEGQAAVRAVRTLDLVGLSVTMPHKDAAFEAVDGRTPVAAALGAVNCVFRDGDGGPGGRLVGDNTDGPGFVDSLRVDHGIDVAGRRCVLLGAGGAGRALAWALGQAGAADVAVVNRSPAPAERAAELAGAVGRVGSAADVAAADLVVNATSIGMGDDPRLPVDADALHEGQIVADIVYFPSETPLLRAAAARGATTVPGIGMLVHQAAHALRRWASVEPPIAAMTAAAQAELERRARTA
ncbi:MAG TPA: shikimate dehydrogenase [Acidimicrobiales bacterium]